MNNNPYDKEELYCPVCGHHWLLWSNKEITDFQYNVWIQYVVTQHERIMEEKENKMTKYCPKCGEFIVTEDDNVLCPNCGEQLINKED